MLKDEYWMQMALEQACRAEAAGEVPVGAVLTADQALVAQGHNQPIAQLDPSAHAEIVVLRRAAKNIGNYRLVNTTLYVTLEPCVMCAGAIVQARVERVVFGAYDKRAGAVCSVFQLFDSKPLNHTVNWQGGVLQSEAVALLRGFFAKRR